MPVTKAGNAFSHLIDPVTFNNFMRAFSAKVLQLLLVLGIVILVYRERKKATNEKVYFLAMIISCLFLLIIQTLLPRLSIEYGTLRFFQQVLIILAIPIIVGAEGLVFFLHKTKMLVVTVFFAILFLHLSGFIPQIIGGYAPQLSLNNAGEYYEMYYIHSSDIMSAEWLNQISEQKSVHFDLSSSFRLLNYTRYNTVQSQQIITNGSYEYLYTGYPNVVDNVFYANIKGTNIRYEVNGGISDRNDIYNNAYSKVYK
jgi:uncharacterized membrane protein